MSLVFQTIDGTKDLSRYKHAITNSSGPAAILGRRVDIPAANENAYIRIGSAGDTKFTGSDGFTVAEWIRLGRVDVQQYLLNLWGTDASWGTSISASNRAIFLTYDGVGSSTLTGATTLFIANRWYRLIFVYDGGTTGTNGHIYINGEIEIEGTINRVPHYVAGQGVGFGTEWTRNIATDLVGSGSDLRFYNTAWSAGQAKLDYEMTRLRRH